MQVAITSSDLDTLKPQNLVNLMMFWSISMPNCEHRFLFAHGNRFFKLALVCLKYWYYLTLYTSLISYNSDIIVISKHSYFLHQQHDPHPFLSAANHYKASDSHDRIKKALEEVFIQYGKVSHGQKVTMVTDVILQNALYCMWLTYSSTLFFVENFI